MDTNELLAQAEQILQPVGRAFTRPAPDRLDVIVRPNDIEAATQALMDARWGYLVAITGLDRPGLASIVEEKAWTHVDAESNGSETGGAVQEGAIELLYHFGNKAAVLTLRTSVHYSAPEIRSICNIIPAATLYERELAEMLGVRLAGTPNTDRLLLPDDWPDGVFPLRKSFKSLEQAVAEAKE